MCDCIYCLRSCIAYVCISPTLYFFVYNLVFFYLSKIMRTIDLHERVRTPPWVYVFVPWTLPYIDYWFESINFMWPKIHYGIDLINFNVPSHRATAIPFCYWFRLSIFFRYYINFNAYILFAFAVRKTKIIFDDAKNW